VTGIAEHHTEQEGKCNDGVKSRIDLAIRRYAVRVDQVLKALGELVGSVERRRILVRVDHVEKGRYRATAEALEKRNISASSLIIRHFESRVASRFRFLVILKYRAAKRRELFAEKFSYFHS